MKTVKVMVEIMVLIMRNVQVLGNSRVPSCPCLPQIFYPWLHSECGMPLADEARKANYFGEFHDAW